FVVTGKARARIRRFIRMQQRHEYAHLGKAMLQKVFRQEGYDFTEKAVSGVLKQFRQSEAEDLYANIGSGLTPARDVFNAVFPGHAKTKAKEEAEKAADQTIVNPPKTRGGKGKKGNDP